MVTGAFPLSSPSTKTSTSGSLEMMRRLPLPLAAAPKVAATLTCCPATTVTVWRQGAIPSLRTSTTWSPAVTPGDDRRRHVLARAVDVDVAARVRGDEQRPRRRLGALERRRRASGAPPRPDRTSRRRACSPACAPRPGGGRPAARRRWGSCPRSAPSMKTSPPAAPPSALVCRSSRATRRRPLQRERDRLALADVERLLLRLEAGQLDDHLHRPARDLERDRRVAGDAVALRVAAPGRRPSRRSPAAASCRSSADASAP